MFIFDDNWNLLFVGDYADCIRHNFTFLQDELLEIEEATDMIFKELTPSDLSDIKCCKGTIRQISKLIKIILIKRNNACEEFLKALPIYLKRTDVIPMMKTRSAVIRSRGNWFNKIILSKMKSVTLKKNHITPIIG